jgi:hypothetical protein
MKDFSSILLFVFQLSLALTFAELGAEFIKFLARMFYDKVILWVWAVIR